MVSAIILAGGKGKRMGAKISKQFIELNGKPILYYTLKKFSDCEEIDKIILVLPKDEIEYCNKEILEKYSLKVDMIVEGGKERQDSVYNALQKINDSEIVLIHDGARAFVSERVIKDGIKYAKLYGAAAPGVMPKDTIKVVDENGFSDSTPDRSKLLAIQTPQTFKLEVIKECHNRVKENNINVTDDTMVVEMYNHKVYLYKGEYTNIKVTTPEDLILAEKLI
ncbi:MULTISPECIES: 2-C-methyl-D-erythritol 4-phosphate cytidylyltransferase [unclassified Clostridium]|uniref:2-C-methyl-D-erythritol 4-phosphate cytidylyltransferase n=1 Tax=unclassified Clostridium TaxID=2614128 RepID=UPI001897E008|nr:MULTISPECIES: 2-C-methyl-D-erythritol 4-phosphate cytidylyltransferase [unclassified Clostridium]MCR1952829.1 2-C-methyl-D-erythritol 4-phosphate cytidylyltransferase [Clostridium sp. DSM 100503]